MARIFRFSLILALGATACAEERPPINRVQPNYFDKAFFLGARYLDSSDDPEFYSQGTLIDVGYGAGQDGLFTSTYAQPMSRVRWSILEEYLIARLAYERVSNSDGKGAGKATNDGIVVAAYKILKHFDIQRTYNPSTGEQLNVFEENDFDRPWYERQFIRVDWSKNLSTDNYDFDTLSQLGVYGGIVYEPLSYYVNDPAHEHAPRFVPEEGYLDLTNKAFAKPQMVDISHLGWGLGAVPACWFDADFMGGSAPATGCSPVELTIRQAFLKVKDRDYEPVDWDGQRFQAFGAFVTQRYGYARNYGMTDTQWHRFINRYNLWERSHHYQDPRLMLGEVSCFTPETTPAGKDPHRDEDGDGTEDECAAVGGGSRCDELKQRCTLPYRQRTPVTIPWYYASGGLPDYFDATEEAAHEWDVALRSAVMAARYTECAHTGGQDCAAQHPVYFGQMDDNADAVALAREVDDCRTGRAHFGQDCMALADDLGRARGYSAGVVALAKLEEMVVLCHSPVEGKDHFACGGQRLPEGLTAAVCAAANAAGDRALATICGKALNVRRGDIRYHQVNAIAQPQTPSPWGIMVDANDPLTGETVSASINVWTHVTDLWSQGVVDVARYIRGELTTQDVTEGKYVNDWARAAEAATRNGAVPPMARQEVQARVAELSGAKAEDLDRIKANLEALAPGLAKKLRRVSREADGIRADASAPSAMKPKYDARRARAAGTAMEAALTTPMMQSYAGAEGLPSSEAALALASPLRGANPALARDLWQRRELALAEQGACVIQEAPAPLAIADLAELLEAKFGKFDPNQSKADQLARAEKMRRYLAHRAHYAVTTHEMGHSIGLRHNFVSSSDAWNFRPQYWQLRTSDGKVTNPCTDLRPDGSCIGPRYFDPVTENERKNLIAMFMQSSTMDYAGEATQDLLGLGAYDFAAARLFYGDVASVYRDDSFKAGGVRAVGVLEKLDNFGGILGFRPSIGSGSSPTDTIDIHYSQLQRSFDLMGGCRQVDPNLFKPGRWSEEAMGQWHPLLDGLIVQVDGVTTRCRQQPVDYVPWRSLRNAGSSEVGFTRSSHAIDPSGRVRVPYGFATDRWADLGNLSVYRHDNGADPYELFDFLITQQEVNHIFDNYRRNRQTFSVRGAANRSLYRYSEKLRDAAKGLGLMANVYRDFAQDMGYDFEGLWPYISDSFFRENILASGIGFDHFARQLARPEAGPHYLVAAGPVDPEPVLRSGVDTAGNGGPTSVVVPNGATGYFRNVSAGGRPLENSLAEDKGEYDSEYTINAGSYYDKAWTAMLMTESVDNFISDSRRDFLDARYRAVSMADLFPDGYRRWLGNNLTGDDELKGYRIETAAGGAPVVDGQKFPARGLGWTSWWPSAPQVCFPTDTSILCSAQPGQSVAVDPQIGWEQQKFLIAWTLLFLPENQQQHWLNMMDVWELGADADPEFQNRIEYHSPTGKTYVAKTFGRETIFGKSVQKGIAARMLEHANELVQQAYDTTAGPDRDGDGKPDWFVPVLGAGGKPRVKFDPGIRSIDSQGNLVSGRPGCNATDNSSCTCSSNRACLTLSRYEEVPFFMRQAMRDYGLPAPSLRGIY
ncbi:MAG: hypothetical protein HYZ28_14045 [Myxococcales bacterium]|nr:hypothetical protein [Myxococcales bacterium]